MNAVLSPHARRLLALFLLALCCMSLVTPILGAAEANPPFATLQANAILQLVSDRSRLIQVSIVCVLLGCAMLWWKR